jgi:hypothetical protein
MFSLYFWRPARALPFACGPPTYRPPRGLPILVSQTFSLRVKLQELSRPGGCCSSSFPNVSISTGAASSVAVLIALRSHFALAACYSSAFPSQLSQFPPPLLNHNCIDAGGELFSNERANTAVSCLRFLTRVISRIIEAESRCKNLLCNGVDDVRIHRRRRTRYGRVRNNWFDWKQGNWTRSVRNSNDEHRGREVRPVLQNLRLKL